jgi:hypothetical protein
VIPLSPAQQQAAAAAAAADKLRHSRKKPEHGSDFAYKEIKSVISA